MAKFTADMSMGDVLAINPEARYVLESFGMHCIGCPVSQAESLEDACMVHGIDVDEVLAELEEIDSFEPENTACNTENNEDCEVEFERENDCNN